MVRGSMAKFGGDGNRFMGALYRGRLRPRELIKLSGTLKKTIAVLAAEFSLPSCAPNLWTSSAPW
jgi:hypothetical protein